MLYTANFFSIFVWLLSYLYTTKPADGSLELTRGFDGRYISTCSLLVLRFHARPNDDHALITKLRCFTYIHQFFPCFESFLCRILDAVGSNKDVGYPSDVSWTANDVFFCNDCASAFPDKFILPVIVKKIT